MKPTITVNQYPIGWEWLDRVPLEDFTWLIEIFSIMTDNTDTYDFVGYTDSETLPGQQKVCSVDKIPLANFLNNNHLHSEHIRLQIREILQIPLTDITIIDIISLP